MKIFEIILMAAASASLLTACSIEGMVEKSVPADVRADHSAHIDKLLARDTSLIERVFNLDMENEETQAQIAKMLENVPAGAEVRRDYVGLNSATGINTGEGKTRDISLVSEVQTKRGFMTVTSQYALDAKGNCCALTNINVRKFDNSPVRVGLEAVAKISKMVGLGILALGISLIAFLMFRRRRKAAQAGRG